MDFGKFWSGMIAGFAGTVALSILMIIKSMLGLMPDLNPIRDIVTVADQFTGAQFPLFVGWIGHFAIGSIAWGIAYVVLEPVLPGAAVVKGLLFAVIAWLAMMIVFMPLAGQGFFGLKEGPPAVVATLVLHLVYGAVLGLIYASLTARSRLAAKAA